MEATATYTDVELLPARKQHAPRKLNYSKCSYCRDSKVKAKVSTPTLPKYILSLAEMASVNPAYENGLEKNAKTASREDSHVLRRRQLAQRGNKHASKQMSRCAGPRE